MRTIDKRVGIWPLTLEQIEATVAAHLGPGRVPGNEQGPCFSRQISMYLGNRVGGWSTTRIGKFYNGRHHTTVLHAIGKVEHLRKTDESIYALVEILTAAVCPKIEEPSVNRSEPKWRAVMIDAVAARVIDRLVEIREQRESRTSGIMECSRVQNEGERPMNNFLRGKSALDGTRTAAIGGVLTFQRENNPDDKSAEKEHD